MAVAEKVEVGRFTYDPTAGTVSGPADYMREQGQRKLRLIEGGHDKAFNMSAHLSPNIVVAILVHMQTDYAGWRGQKEMEGWLNRGDEG